MGAEVHVIRSRRNVLRAKQGSASELQIGDDVLRRSKVPFQINRIEPATVNRLRCVRARGAAEAGNATLDFGLVDEVYRYKINGVLEIATQEDGAVISREDFSEAQTGVKDANSRCAPGNRVAASEPDSGIPGIC